MESYMISATSVVYGTDAHCYNRTDCSSQSGSGKSQTDWEHEYIIKYNVKDTSTDGTDHCNRRRSIVSGKCSKCIIWHEEWCCDQNNSHIVSSKSDQSGICTQQSQCLVRNEDSDQHKWNCSQYAPGYWLYEIMFCIFSFCPAYGIPGSGTNPDHSPNRIDQSINRQDQIENCQSVSTGIYRYKESICQNINRNPDHSGNTLGYISGESFQHNTSLLRYIVSIVFLSSADLSHHYTHIKQKCNHKNSRQKNLLKQIF